VSAPTAARGEQALADMVDLAIDGGLAYLRKLDPDAASDLDQVRRQQEAHASVVVVGETKRGKSSLINALLGIPGLSPVDAAVATSAYLEFRHDPGGRRAAAYVPGTEDPVPLSVEDLRDWGTVLGSLPDGMRPPRRIEVRCEAPVLEQLTLVDTPGVGGLDPAHSEIALDAVEKATALLVVVDASSPFAKPELDFLVEASRRVNLVLFALTKIDAYPGWRTVLDDDRALLRTHTPRFAGADFFPVSALLAEVAASLPPEAGGELLKESRITELRSALAGQVAARAGLLRKANVLRSVRSELVRLDQVIGDRMKSADPDPTAAQRLKDERVAIASRKRTDARSWQMALNAETRRARTDATARLRQEVQQQQDQWMKAIDSAKSGQLKRLPHDLDRSLQAMSLRLSADLDRRFRLVAEKAMRDAVGEAHMRMLLTTLNSRLATGITTRPRREGGGQDQIVVASASVGTASLFMGLIGGGPLGIAIGLGAGAYMLYRRRAGDDKQQARVWLREVLNETRAAVGDEIAHRFTDAEFALTQALDDAIERRVADIDAQIADIDRSMAQDKASRQARKAALQGEREQLRARIKQLDEPLGRVRQATRAAADRPTAPAAPMPPTAPEAVHDGTVPSPAPVATPGA